MGRIELFGRAFLACQHLIQRHPVLGKRMGATREVNGPDAKRGFIYHTADCVTLTFVAL